MVTLLRGVLRRNRDFRWFWAGHTASVVGSQVTAVALPLLASLTLDAGAAGVAVVATASYLPNLLLPLLIGHWLERRRRRPVMIGADVVRAGTLAVVPVAYLLGFLSVPLLVVVALVVGVASVVFEIGSFAYVPSLVDDTDLAGANRATQGSTTAAQVAGPGLAGGLTQLAGPPLAVALDAVSYLASALGVAAARRVEPAPPREDAAGILDGLRVIAVNPWLRALTTHATIYNAASQIVTVNLVVLMVTDRGLGPGLFGLALSAAGAGALVGTLASTRLAERLGYGRAFAAALLLSTGTPLLITALPGSGGALAAGLAGVQFTAGIGLGVANVLSVTLRQVVIPRGNLARSGGGYRVLIYGALPLGSALGGVLGHAAGSRVGVAVGTVGFAVSAVPMLTRRIRGLRTPQQARPADAAPTVTAPADGPPTAVRR